MWTDKKKQRRWTISAAKSVKDRNALESKNNVGCDEWARGDALLREESVFCLCDATTAACNMDCAPNVNIFRELQAVHDTGYFSGHVSPEEDWQQVRKVLRYAFRNFTLLSIRLLQPNRTLVTIEIAVVNLMCSTNATTLPSFSLPHLHLRLRRKGHLRSTMSSPVLRFHFRQSAFRASVSVNSCISAELLYLRCPTDRPKADIVSPA